MGIYMSVLAIITACYLEVAGQTPAVLSSYSNNLDYGAVAQLIAVPPGLTPHAYAKQLVETEGISSWDGSPPREGEAGPFSYVQTTAGDGASILILAALRPRAGAPLVVCRVKSPTAGLSESRGLSNQWCASQLGFPGSDSDQTPLIVPTP